MKRPVSPLKLGLFVLLGLALGLGILIWIGAANIFQETRTYASFFDFSIAGMQRGAPVQRLGVQVGQISEIRLAPDGNRVQVLVEIQRDMEVTDAMYLLPVTQGLVGQTYLALESADAPLPRPDIPYQVDYPVLPNRQGEMDRIFEQAQEIAGKLAELDIAGLVDRVEKTVAGAESLVNDPDLRKSITNLGSASAELESILAGLSGPEGSRDWRAIYHDIAGTAETLRQTSRKLSQMAEEVPPDAVQEVVAGARDLVATGERAVGAWDRQVDRNLGQLSETISRINLLVSEMERLVRTLQQDPGQILQRRQGSDPFAR